MTTAIAEVATGDVTTVQEKTTELLAALQCFVKTT
jgi:hypothetical protein